MSFQLSGPPYFRKLPAIPVIFAHGGDVLDQFAPVAAIEFGVAFTG
jgi:hypothetical protein